MDCSKAGSYMMKYMDQILSEEETFKLNEHLEKCASCKADFIVYQHMMSSFCLEESNIEAPEGFADRVMCKINSMEPYKPDNFLPEGFLENAAYILWSIFSVSIGAGLLLTFNHEQVMKLLSYTPSWLESWLNSIVFNLEQMVMQLSLSVSAIFDSTLLYINDFRDIFLVVFLILAAIQLFLYQKEKIKI